LVRHYDKLSPEERFRLDILATARGDLQESERLVGSCPRHTYTMTERGFGGRWTAARNATGGLQVLCAEQLGKLAAVDVMRAMLPYSRALHGNLASEAYATGLKAGGLDPDECADAGRLEAAVDECAAFLPEVADRLECAAVAVILELWEGYAAFCEESMGVAPEKAAAALVGPLGPGIEDARGRAGRLGAEPDPTKVEASRQGFAEVWETAKARGV
jgi:hypothetical protein